MGRRNRWAGSPTDCRGERENRVTRLAPRLFSTIRPTKDAPRTNGFPRNCPAGRLTQYGWYWATMPRSMLPTLIDQSTSVRRGAAQSRVCHQRALLSSDRARWPAVAVLRTPQGTKRCTSGIPRQCGCTTSKMTRTRRMIWLERIRMSSNDSGRKSRPGIR